ncbi:MAG: protein kinase [Planctomycetota bacterium]
MASDPLLERRAFGPFELLELLGVGGSARVYRARRAGRCYALKLPRLASVLTPAGRARLAREAELALTLGGPGIVPLLEAGEVDGRPYLLYELVVGAPLRESWRGAGLRQRVGWVRDAARAAARAHARGVIHRDLKPENLLVDRAGALWVGDFGLGWSAEEASLTATGEVLGTPLYLAPEQALEGKAARGPQNDVWSLGVILCEALVGEHPYAERGLLAALHAGAPLAPRARDPQVPARLDAACARALRFDPDARHPDAGALADELDAWLADSRGEGGSLLAGSGARSRTDPTPQRIGPYELVGQLGQGGMGVVYLGRGPDGEEVALKTLRSCGAEERRRLRFVRELQALRELDHPGIVRFRDAGSEGELLWLAMERLRGHTLQARLETQGPLSSAETRALGLSLASALGRAHELGIVHRDLKPENVFLEAERGALLTDFGLAGFGDAQGGSLTQSGALLGTPSYMSPEQAAGAAGAAAPPTDVYGLGAVLYACLTGRAPAEGDTLAEVLVAVRDRPPRPPHELAAEVDPDLEAVVLRCLRKRAEDRYPDMAALARALAGEVRSARLRARAAVAAALALLALALLLALPRVRLARAVRAARAAPAAEAAARWETVLELAPDHAEALRARTLARVRAQDWRGASADADRLVALRPGDPDALITRAQVYTSGLGWERARQDLRAALDLAPARADAWRSLAELLLQHRRYDEALDAASRALELDPQDGRARYVRGVVRRERSPDDPVELRAAVADLRAALERLPAPAPGEVVVATRRGCLLELGVGLLSLDRLDEAASLLEAGDARDDLPLALLRCQALLGLGRVAEARRDLDALATRPAERYAGTLALLRALAAGLAGDYAAAREVLAAARRDPRTGLGPLAPYLDLWACAFGGEPSLLEPHLQREDGVGRSARALRYGPRFVPGADSSPSADDLAISACFVGVARERGGDVAGALQAYAEAQRGDPSSLHRIWVRWRLAGRCQPPLPP